MTTTFLHAIPSRYSFASAYSSLNPCEVRSPEQTTMSGCRSLISVIARSSSSGRKNCCPQCRSLSWAIVNAIVGGAYRRDGESRPVRRPKTKQRKDAGSADSGAIGASEDAAMRRFAGGRADDDSPSRRSEDPAHGVVQRGGDERGGGQCQEPGYD